ncbi:MAG: hypothetical protein RJA25_1288 [Bacteroidota bacterium]|jgi:hypothetical protein
MVVSFLMNILLYSPLYFIDIFDQPGKHPLATTQLGRNYNYN